MKASELYASGKLEEAITAMNDEVRSRPSDVDARGFLIELLCIAGRAERADVHLETVARLDPKATLGVALIRHLIRAEQWRQQFHTEGRLPEFLTEPSDDLQLHLRASILLREGDGVEAARLLDEAEEKRPRIRGSSGGATFDDFRDLDDLTASFLEVLTSNGKYYWIPLERIVRIELHKPARPRDVIWRRASMSVRDGPDGEIYLPSIYAPAGADLEPAERLGRASDWTGGDGAPVRGRGLRTFLVGDEARTILELDEIEFAGDEA